MGQDSNGKRNSSRRLPRGGKCNTGETKVCIMIAYLVVKLWGLTLSVFYQRRQKRGSSNCGWTSHAQRKRVSTGNFAGYPMSYVKAYSGNDGKKGNTFLCGQACGNKGGKLDGCKCKVCNIVDFAKLEDWAHLCVPNGVTKFLVYWEGSTYNDFKSTGKVEDGAKIYCSECFQKKSELGEL